MWVRIQSLPLGLLFAGIMALAMYVPALHAIALDDPRTSRLFFYSGTLMILSVALLGLAIETWAVPKTEYRNLQTFVIGFFLLPLFLAVPLYETLQTTSFLNAYLDMLSCLTTTGAIVFDPERLNDSLHLWRALVAWIGGGVMWIAAVSILAPLNLGGFEVTSTALPNHLVKITDTSEQDPMHRIFRSAKALVPPYVFLTGSLAVILLVDGTGGMNSVIYAMSTMSTSGVTSHSGTLQAGVLTEATIALFLLFALSRITFSADTMVSGRGSILVDAEFRLGMLIVISVPLFLFIRHWLGAIEFNDGDSFSLALQAYWGGMFTAISFLTTTGFESEFWNEAQNWSGLSTPGLVLMGLTLIGGGVATTAGGVKLLRVYALYLNGHREMELLVHPSSMDSAGYSNKRIRRNGAYIAWVFFMIMALCMALSTCLFAATGQEFDDSFVLSISALTTTGPLLNTALGDPVTLAQLNPQAACLYALMMIIGRVEVFAIFAIFSNDFFMR